jgi:glycosyltransferase involved in cell wall biosynthesis
LLRQALASVVSQDYPKSAYQILVVDNGSTDHTPSVVSEFLNEAEIVYVLESEIGLCIARNTGWRMAVGSHVAYFDDDAIAHPGWLASIADVIGRAGDRLGVAGGRVDPIWQGERPSWLSDKIVGSLTIVDWGPDEFAVKNLAMTWLVGANMVVARDRLESVGGFDARLDRYKDNLLSSGDVFLQKEIARTGASILYVPSMAISHIVPPSRLRKRWFRRRFYWQGISDAVIFEIEQNPTRRRRLKAAAGQMVRLLRSTNRLRALAWSTDDPDQFALKCFALRDIGYMLELLGAARR